MASFDSGDISALAWIQNTAAVTDFDAYTVPADRKALILEVRSDNRTSATHEITIRNSDGRLELVGSAALLLFQGKLVLAATEDVAIVKASSNDVRVIVIGIEVAV